MGVAEGEGEKKPGRSHGNEKSRDAAANGKDHAFGKSQQNNLPPGGAHGQTESGLPAAAHGPHEQQVSHIRARDQQNQRADNQKNPRRLRPYCSFMAPTPAPAGTTSITCFGSVLMMSGIQLAG